jgi:benzoate/toluate 1,2-dioxygenase beta subunit
MNDVHAPAGLGSTQDIVGFLHHEARLLDEGRLEEWLDLYTEDAIYWIPSRPGQTDTRGVPSIIHEDRALLTIRIRRLMHPRAYAALPTPRTLHIIGNVDVVDGKAAGADCRVTSNLLVVEHQDGHTRLFPGRCEHAVRRQGAGLRISAKRIDLIDCDSVYDRPMTILL